LMVTEAIPRVVRGELTPQPQNEQGATYSARVVKEEGEINWQATAEEIWRYVRAFQPWPGAYTLWRGKRLEIQRGFPLAHAAREEAGTVVDLSKVAGQASLGVVAGEGIFVVGTVQLAGKKAMSSVDFLRGQPGMIGTKLPSLE
jgi:methionyl-tRNA formyltransferase